MDFKNDSSYFMAFRKLFRAYNDFQMDAVKKSNYDLSPNEIVVLSVINELSTASEIAAVYDVSKALVSRSVKYLKQKKLIEICISEVDKREQRLSLTAEGDRLAGIIADAGREFCDRVLGDFEINEKEVLQALLRLMLDRL